MNLILPDVVVGEALVRRSPCLVLEMAAKQGTPVGTPPHLSHLATCDATEDKASVDTSSAGGQQERLKGE